MTTALNWTLAISAAASALFAGLAYLWARRSASVSESAADAAIRAASIEEGRDHRERAPQFAVAFTELPKQAGTHPEGARIRVKGPTGYESVQATLLPPDRGEPQVVHQILSPQTTFGGAAGKPVPLGSVELGGELLVEFQFEYDRDEHGQESRRGGEVRVALTFTNDADESWSALATVQVPHPPVIMVG